MDETKINTRRRVEWALKRLSAENTSFRAGQIAGAVGVVTSELRRLRDTIAEGQQVYVCSECGRMWNQNDKIGILFHHNRDTGEHRATCEMCLTEDERQAWGMENPPEHDHQKWHGNECPCPGCE